MWGISTWFAGHDEFGSSAKFNYRGESGYGTGYGGLCSLIVTIISGGFISLMLFGFFYTAQYNSNATTLYLGSGGYAADPYNITVGQFIPTFWIVTDHADDSPPGPIEYNNVTNFDYYFETFDDSTGQPPVRVEAINCVTYINGDKWNDYDAAARENAIGELDKPDYQLCPDLSWFEMNKGYLSDEKIGLRFIVKPNDYLTSIITTTEGQDIINDTMVYSSIINQFFDPESYTESGQMGFLSLISYRANLKKNSNVESLLYVKQEQINFYDFPLLDTSQISVFDLGTSLIDYKVESSQKTITNNPKYKLSLFTSEILQSREFTTIDWSINSLDLILGLVGGFTSIIWASLGFVIQPYEDFKFNNSLVGSIYPTSPQRDEDEAPIADEKEANEALEGTVVERGKFYYTFSEYWFTKFVNKMCCCCVNKDSLRWKVRNFKFERYEKAVEKMNAEIDILKHIQNQRVSEFIAKLVLRKHQRALVQSFQKYQLDDMIAEEEAVMRQSQMITQLANAAESDDLLDSIAGPNERYKNLNEKGLTDQQRELIDEIREKFDPKEVVADLCILYEVTAYKDESAEANFWEGYMDFFELGADENLVRFDNLDERALEPEQRKEYRNRQSRAIGDGDVTPRVYDGTSPNALLRPQTLNGSLNGNE